MPRIRSFKPEIWLSPQVMNLSRDARLLFLGLITQADDYGRGSADPRKLKAAIFPGDDDITAKRVDELKLEVSAQGLSLYYDGNGHGTLFFLPGWHHQRVEKRKPSNYPEPPKPDSSGSSPGSVPDASGTSPGGSDLIRSDQKGSDQERARASPCGYVDNLPRGARRGDDLKKPTEPEEIERRRRQAAELAQSIAKKRAGGSS